MEKDIGLGKRFGSEEEGYVKFLKIVKVLVI